MKELIREEYNMPQGSSAVRPTNGLYLYLSLFQQQTDRIMNGVVVFHGGLWRQHVDRRY